MEWKIIIDDEYLVHRDFKEEEHPRGKDGKFVASGKGFDTAETVVKTTAGATKNIAEGVDKLVPNKKGVYTHPDYSEIETSEMQKEVNRMRLENDYAQLKGESKYIPTGEEKTHEALQTIGIISSIAIAVTPAVVKGIKWLYNTNKNKK